MPSVLASIPDKFRVAAFVMNNRRSSMRGLLLIGALAFGLAEVALAQPDPVPREIEADATIELAVGQAKTFQFQSAITSVNVATDGVAKATPQSDRVITVVGVAQGQTMLLVYGRNGERLYSADVIVSTDIGRSVKLYGQHMTADGLNKLQDYVGYYCTPTTCSRADKDKGPPPPVQTTITRGSSTSTFRPF